MPRMPSNLAAMKVTPGCLIASPNSCFPTERSPIWKQNTWSKLFEMTPGHYFKALNQLTVHVSWLRYPDKLPDPYWMAKAVPFFTYVLDLAELYLWWSTAEMKQDMGELCTSVPWFRADRTYSMRCPAGSSGWKEPTGWMSPCQTLRWTSEEVSPGRSLHNTEPGQKHKTFSSLWSCCTHTGVQPEQLDKCWLLPESLSQLDLSAFTESR